MTRTKAARTRSPLRIIYVVAAAVLLVLLVGASSNPPEFTSLAWGLSGLYLVVSVFPVVSVAQGREEVVVLQEIPLAAALIALPPVSVIWAVLIGSVLARLLIPVLAPLERMRHAGWRRHAANTAIEIIGLVPVLGIASTLRGDSVAIGLTRAVAGTLSLAIVTRLIVSTLVGDAPSGARLWRWLRPAHPTLWALGTVFGAALGVLIGLNDRTQAQLLLMAFVGFGVIAFSVNVLRRQLSNDQLDVVTHIAENASRAHAIARVDAIVTSSLQRALNSPSVHTDNRPPEPPETGAPLTTERNEWLIASPRAHGAPFTSDDTGLLAAVAAIIGPIRDRLFLMDRLREAEAFKSLVLAAAGHDLGNRLTAARLGIQMVQSRTSDDGAALDALTRSTTAIESATDTLQDLLELTRMERSTRAVQEMDGDAIRRFVDRLQLTYPVTVEAEPGARTRVHHLAVERAVENLLRNADRYHEGDEPLLVTLRSAGDRTVVTVEDRGPGLPPRQIDELFEPFTQVGSQRDGHGGVGLGLYLARGFVETVGGILRYEPRRGGGARFLLDLPDVQPRTASSS